jgi:hypothetical protein
VVDCITPRKGAIYQYATIGGLHPGRTDTPSSLALVSTRKVVPKVRAEMMAAATEMAVAEMVATEMAEVVAAESSESIGRERHAAERENCGQCNE